MTAAALYQLCGVTALPFDPASAARALGISLVSYDTLRKNGVSPDISSDGFSFVVKGKRKIAFATEGVSLCRQRWTLTHELCHFALGHLAPNAPPLSQKEERDADRLAAQLLCPVAVLHLCGVDAAAEAAQLCGVSQAAAEIAFARLERQRHSGDPLLGQQELLSQMLPFISAYISQKSLRKSSRRRYGCVDI